MSALATSAVSVGVQDFVLSGDFTIQAWVYFEPGDAIGNADGIVASAQGDLNFYDGRFRLHDPESGLWDVVVANTASVAGTWTHYSVTREDGITRIYVDGQLDATAGQALTGDFAISSIAAGKAGLNSGSGLNGRLDEVQIWDRARSASEIRDDRAGVTDPAEPGLLRYYKIENGDTALIDATGNAAPVALPAGAAITPEGAPIEFDGSAPVSVAIANAGFEAQTLGDGGFANQIDGWQIGGSAGTTGVWNPTAAFFGAGAPEGQNVVFIDNGGTISQTLAETFEAGRSYQLSVKVGDEAPAGENLGWEVRLYAGDTLLGSVGNDEFNPGNGGFVDAVLTLNATDLASSAPAYGAALRIELFDAVTGPENNAHFDDVRLSYVEADSYPGGGGGSGSGEFIDTQVASGLFLPTDLAFLPDGRMLVIEKGGLVKIVEDPTRPGSTVETYLDISGITLNDAERGLLAVEVDPNFDTNGYVYFYHTILEDDGGQEVGRTTVSRFTHVENAGGTSSRADSASQTILWQEHDVTSACCHQGGGLSIAFEPIGPDDPSPYKLYIVTSDEFEPQTAQDLTHDDGKVHRVNLTDGSIPADNPYYDAAVAAAYTPGVDTLSAISTSAENQAVDPDGVITTIHSHGLRNGWRSSYDQESNTLFIGEVGGNNNNTSREDIHIAVAGADYGWPGSEGFLPDPNDPGNPIFSYPHLNGPGQGGGIQPGAAGASLTGGVVYRGSDFPDEYTGAYFYGDWVRNWIRYLEIDYSGDRPTVVSDNFFKNATGQVLAFEEGPDGALYYITTFQTGNVFTFQGAVNRIDFEGGNSAPAGSGIALDPGADLGSSVPYTVTFEADVTDPDGDALTYAWSFGDGEDLDGDGIGDTATSTERNPTYTYTAFGQYTVELVVTDENGATTVFDSKTITIGNAPEPTITLPLDGGTYRAGQEITLDGFANDVEDGLIDDNGNLIWSTTFRLGDVSRPGPVDGAADQAGGITFTTPDTGNLESALDGITVFLTATDSDGLSTTRQIDLTAEKALLSFDAPIEDYSFVFDGRGETGDFTFNSIINFNHTVEAQASYSDGGIVYTFSHWADDPANTDPIRAITTPETGATFRPVYEAPPVTPQTLSLDGSAPVDVPQLVLGLNGSDFTIESWVRFDGTISNIDGLGGAGAFRNGTDINFYQGQIRIYASGAGDPIIANHVSQPDVWTHYAVVREAGELKIYVDGVLDQTTATGWTGAFTIDHIGGGVQAGGLSGEMDEWRAWSVARTAEEIAGSKDTAFSELSLQAGLERYYSFDAGLQDQTGNSAPGTLPTGGTLVPSTSPVTLPVDPPPDPPVEPPVDPSPVLPDPVFEQAGTVSYSGASADVTNIAPGAEFELAEGTIAFSFKDDDLSGRQGLVSKDASNFVGGGHHFAAYLSGDDLHVRFQDADSSDSFIFRDIAPGREYEVAAVFGDGVQLWVDGELVGEDPAFDMDWTQNQQYLQIGGLGWASASGEASFGNPFSGEISDFQIFDRMLDQDQIRFLADDGFLIA